MFLAFLTICSCTAVYPVQPFPSKIRRNPDPADRCFNMGIAHYSLRDYDAAAESFAETVRIDPLDRDARIRLGLSYAYMDSISAAESILKQEYPFDNTHLTYTEKGMAYKTIGRYEEAVQAYQKALDMDEPHPLLIHSRLGTIFFNIGRFDDAIREFETVVSSNRVAARNYNAFLNLASSYYHSGEYEKAAGAYQNTIKYHPGKAADAFFGLGNVKYQEGNMDEAFELYTKAIENNDKHAGAYYNLCLIAVNYHKNTESAINYFNILSKLNPQLAKKLHYHLQSMAQKK